MTLKEDLVACYKLADVYGLSDLIFGHISIREGSGFHIKEPMMPFSMVNVDNLKFIEIDIPVRSFGEFGIHNQIYKNTNHNAIMHIHSTAICAMSSSNEKLLSINQPSSLVNTSFAEYEYESNLLFDADYSKLVNLIKDFEFIMMRNHGFVTAGKSLLHVFFNSYIFDQACKIQLAGRNHIELDATLVERKKELRLLLKYHQSKRELWDNLIKDL